MDDNEEPKPPRSHTITKMPMMTAAIEDNTFVPVLHHSTMSGEDECDDDFGETEIHSTSSDDEEMVHKTTVSALAGKLLASLSVSNKSEPPANDCVLSEAIAQWDALSHREKEAAYKISATGGYDFVEHHRSRISTYFYSIVDEMELDRRIVSIALSYLKLFLIRRPDGSKQLAMVSSLYIAIKIHSSNIYHNGRPNVTIAEVIDWSGNVFTVEDISRMEASMLRELDYMMNPPVAQHFLDIIAPLIDANLFAPQLKQHIITISNWLCEASVTDSYLTGVKPSSVAYASILVAMETSSEGASVKCWFESFDLKHDAYITLECYERMFELYCLQDESYSRCLSPTEVLGM
jgi:hypothetical protein